MQNLTIIKRNGGAYIDSREVAAAIEKRHDNLLRDIARYCEIIGRGGLLNFEESDFFIESSYLNAQNREMPCYLISRVGCDLIAHKVTGEKGVLFTAAYVTKFREMEAAERAELEARAARKTPRLGECNATARIIVRALHNMGAPSEHIMEFLRELYKPFGISVADDELAYIPQTYTAKQLAKIYGIYSHGGHPHNQAIACILNEILFIGEEHKTVITSDYGNHIGVSVRYNDHAAKAVGDWLVENGCPSEIRGFDRTYYVLYTA